MNRLLVYQTTQFPSKNWTETMIVVKDSDGRANIAISDPDGYTLITLPTEEVDKLIEALKTKL